MRFLRVGICILVVIGVVAHGAVEEWARAVLQIGAALLFLYWALRAYLTKEQTSFIPSLLPPLLALALVGLLQWICRFTASSYHTAMELRLLIAYALIVFLAAQAFRTVEDFRSFAWFVMIFGFLVAIFGILQHLTFNGKLYWFREMRFGGIPFGPYVNRNHFAGFAELVIPFSLVPLVLGKVRRERWFLVAMLAVIPIGALFYSASRGGIVSFAVEAGAIVVWLIVRRSARRHLVSAGAVVLLTFLLVSWLGVRQALERFSTMQSLEVTQGKRTSMARDSWHIFLDHPVIGTGLGTLQTVFPPYETLYDGKVVNHTHNDYLEALAETGILGGACCVWFLGTLLLDALRRLSQSRSALASTLQLSGLVGCLGFLTHSLVDFNLHIPANALLFFLLTYVSTVDIQETGAAIPDLARLSRQPRKH